MAQNLSKRTHVPIDETDVVFVFKESGDVDISFPELLTEEVPEHMLCALALSYALSDKDFVQTIRDRFLHQHIPMDPAKACNDS